MEIKTKGFVTIGGMLCTESKFNSNNGWGFGGAIGTQYQFGKNITMKVAKSCYRHAPSEPFISVWQGDNRLFDKAGHNKKNREAAIALVRELLNNSHATK